jgi:hypothetical protein
MEYSLGASSLQRPKISSYFKGKGETYERTYGRMH